MKYKNAKTVLPERLVKELQKYVQGQIIYVPGDESTRARWGETNGTRKKYDSRNSEIIKLYKKGLSKEAIAQKYHLSVYSIKKIIYNSKDKYYRFSDDEDNDKETLEIE
ncbi:MAG: hypothetical protein GYA02_09595 [Clostridiaceae bacterium]|nr:hypothetical protein [Clostridiaceae bacterium]